MFECRKIKNYEGYYITNESKVYSSKYNSLKELKIRKDKYGYLKLELCTKSKAKTKLVHRLVAESFIDNPENKPEVNHLNGVKDDNRLHNLEWSTSKENTRHACATGLRNSKGENHYKSKLTELEVIDIRLLLNKGNLKHWEIAERFNVSRETISFIKGNRAWKHI